MVIDTIPRTPNVVQRSLTEKAALMAFTAHAGQLRKDGETPYIVHPYMVALKLAPYGFDERVLAAALVHDVLEDTSVTALQLEELLGKEVLQIVQVLTEDKVLPWEVRKERYIEAIRTASIEVKAISTADKIHNLESLFAAHASQGPGIWNVFSRGREQKMWFERSLLTALQKTWTHPLVDEYAKLVEKMNGLE